jgi:hypothetical protein
MKATFTILALALFLITAPLANAQEAKPLTAQQLEMIQKNVLANLEHSSLDVRAATMQLLIEMKKTYPAYNLNYAVLPMMETLKSDPKPEFRILAALALYHLDSDLGRFAVERRAKFDDDDRVARHCASLVRNWGSSSDTDTFMADVKRKL